MDSGDASAARGRPREFCTEAALAAALRVFRAKGYAGASLSDLTDAMGITRPSLYAAFGNKEALFRRALELYDREHLGFVADALDAPSARGVAEQMLAGVLATHGVGEPKGCLYVIHSVACGADAAPARAAVAARRALGEAALRSRFDRAQAEGDLPADVHPADLTAYLTAVLGGMALQADAGASPAQLRQIMETTLRLWPGR